MARESHDTNCIAIGGAALWVATQPAIWPMGVSRDRPRHSQAGARHGSTHLRHGRCWACDTTH